MTDHTTDIQWIKKTLSDMSEKLDGAIKTFETKESAYKEYARLEKQIDLKVDHREFTAVKAIAYGVSGLILTGAVMALLSLIGLGK